LLAAGQAAAQDLVVIAYADSIVQADKKPLQTFLTFWNQRLNSVGSSVHLLPFFPYCSDDGFAVSDFYAVRPDLGDWSDIEAIATTTDLMADLVLNHGSAASEWFQNFIAGSGPGHDYFMVVPANAAVGDVVGVRCPVDHVGAAEPVFVQTVHRIAGNLRPARNLRGVGPKGTMGIRSGHIGILEQDLPLRKASAEVVEQ
ncbi:alpha-amylase family glycosyl hydrolase, partial [Phaeobacter italicus]|uniref:alpha-amylase family glycosyl hydrolase n=1 Tax=Phaeobacter italicus TaxID=481446 RepID=UPI00248EFD60